MKPSRAVASVLLAAAAELAGVTACSSGRAHPIATSTTEAPRTTSTLAPTTTTVVMIPQGSPDAAARALLDAWSAGRRDLAARVASVDALTALFEQPPGPYQDRGCQEPLGGAAGCSFRVGDVLLDVHVVADGPGWIVDRVTSG